MRSKKWTKEEVDRFKGGFSATDFDVKTWQSLGIDFNSACLLLFWGKGPDEAVQLKNRGIAVPPDMRFESVLGYSFLRACKWVEAGFDYDSASAWIVSGFSFAQACKWTKAGLDEVDASIWISQSVTEPAIANSWLQNGFTAETAEEWLKWKIMPVDAKKFVDAGLYAPGGEYTEAGISFSSAMSWISKGFESEEYDGMEESDYWKFWHDAGFTPDLAELLHTKIEESISWCNEKDIHPRGFDRYSFWSVQKVLKEQLVSSVTELSKAGLALTIENLIKWRGVTAKVILASIDNQIDPDKAYELGEVALAPYSKPIHDLLRETKSTSMPQEFTHRGMTEKDLKKLLELHYDLDDIVRVMSDSKIDGPVLLKWATNGWRVTQRGFLPWYAEGFVPQLASVWNSHGFDAVLARAWIKAGVKDPEAARRRSAVGISPTK